jgi:urea transport system substrate-binding protein
MTDHRSSVANAIAWTLAQRRPGTGSVARPRKHAVLAIATVALSTWACSGAASTAAPAGSTVASAGPTAAATSSAPVKIGFLGPFTGNFSGVVDPMFNSFQLAVDEINAAGGIGGRLIEISKEDDASNTTTTVDKMNKLVKETKVDVTVGPFSSLERAAAMSVATAAHSLVMYPIFYEGGVCNDYLFSTGQIPNQQIDPMVPYLISKFGKTNYFVGSDYQWPRASSEWLKTSVEKNGGIFAGAQFFPFGTTDFSPAIREIASQKPDVLWVLTGGNDSVTFIKQLEDASLGDIQVASTGLEDTSVASFPGFLVGALTIQSWFMALDTPASHAYVEAYRKAYGADTVTNSIGESTYDAVYLYKLAVEKAGTTDVAAVAAALPTVEFGAPQGQVRIDAKTHVMVSNSLMGEVQANGTIKVLQNFGAIEPVVTCTQNG